MPTTPGSFIPRFAFWNPSTWAIPELYWDTFSQEQRIHAICKQLGKVIAYADMLGVNVDDISSRLKAIEEGQLDDFIVATIEQWFEDNQPFIMQALAELDEALPISEFDAENTVKDAIDDLATSTQDAIEALDRATQQAFEVLPISEFDAVNTVKAYIDNIQRQIDCVFDTVADMAACATLSDGMTCMTRGYFAVNDGGSAVYEITDSATANGIDIINCSVSGVYATLINDAIGYGSKYGCMGETDITRINRVLAANDIVVFDVPMTVSDTIVIGSGLKVKIARLTYTGVNYAISTTGTGTEIEFDAILASTGAGIYVDCQTAQFNSSKINGRVITSLNHCLYIYCNGLGCIWSDFNILRMASTNGNCVKMLCVPGTSSNISFVGQCNFNISQMKSTNDYAVMAQAKSDYTTLTGIHFGNTAVENSKGGFYIEAESGGSSCSCKMFEIESCRIYEGGYTLPVIKFVGNCYDNSFTVDTPIGLASISYEDVTANFMGRSNEIHGGISSPTGGVFAETAYCTNGTIYFDDIFDQYFLNSGADRTLFDPTDTSVSNWRCHKAFYNSAGHLATISNVNYIVKNNTVLVSQNYSNSSTIKLIDNLGNTIFDGSQFSGEGRKWYEIGRRGTASYWIREVNAVTNWP